MDFIGSTTVRTLVGKGVRIPVNGAANDLFASYWEIWIFLLREWLEYEIAVAFKESRSEGIEKIHVRLHWCQSNTSP